MNALTEDDLKEWITALQTVAFRDKGGTLNRNSTTIEEDNDLYCSSYGDGLFIVKLIPSATSIKCNFEPKNYMLHLTATDIQLKSVDDLSIIIAKWPYKFIRKYGYSDGKFTFEAGRKCKTGEGIFTFYHSNSIEVFRCMSSKTKSMKKLLSGDSLNNLDCGDSQLSAALSMGAGSRSPIPPSPNQSTNEFELNNTSFSQNCMATVRGFLSSNDSLNNSSIGSTSIPSTTTTAATTSTTKHIPNKPPRKLLSPDRSATISSSSLTSTETSKLPLSLPLPQQQQQQYCDKFKKFQNYEPVAITTDSLKTNSSVILKGTTNIDENRNSPQPPDLPNRNDVKKTDRDYESIENITDAWKTLGLNDVKHFEHVFTPEDDLIDFVWQRTQSQRGNENKNSENLISNNNKIISNNDPEPSDSETNYDRLDFLSPNNKIASSGYKTIVTVTSTNSKKKMSTATTTTLNSSSTTSSSSVNDYELIASPDIQPCRKADDSYLGYGVLRKPSIPGPQVPTSIKNVSTTMINDDPSLDHRNYNGMNYAIVSKPKRV